MDFYKSSPDQYTTISVSDFISLNTDSRPKRGDWVMVGDSEPPKHKRMFLTKVEGAEWPYLCVLDADESSFQKGENFKTASWKFMAPIVEPEQVEPTNNRRALLENPELLPLIKDLYSYRKQNPQFDPLPCAKRFIASELSILDEPEFRFETADGVVVTHKHTLVYGVNEHGIHEDHAVGAQNTNPNQLTYYSTREAAEAYLKTLIEGYVVPFDMYRGSQRSISKGDIVVKMGQWNNYLEKSDVYCTGHSFPAEWVENHWKPVYRNPYPEQPNG